MPRFSRPCLLPAWLLLACFLAGLPSLAAAAEIKGPVRHELSFPQRANQYVHLRAIFPADVVRMELAMPSWTPGSYRIRDYAGNVEGMRAHDGSGRDLAVTKTAKNRWRIEGDGAGEVTVEYDVWAGEMNVATNWVERDRALLNGAGLFLYNETSRHLPQQVSVRLPPDWPAVYTALPRLAGPAVFQARDYDELVDSPLVSGSNPGHYPFRVKGGEYALVVVGENPWWDSARARDDLAHIVEAQQDFWGVDPFGREYLFLLFLMEAYGGLEHDHSTVIMSAPWQMTTKKDYTKWLGTASHEFFHAWNVRRMRPAALAHYDYDRETYTRELWLAEGLTSYYDDLLLFRSGLIDVTDYFELLAQEIRNYESMPGRQVRSAERASFDTWIKHYQPDENSINSTVSYYRKGAVVGFVTDTAIRRQTSNAASLDTVMRGLYKRYGPGGPEPGGYPPGAFEASVEAVAGGEVRASVERWLQSTEDPDVDAALAWYGLVLDRTDGATNGDVGEVAGFGVGWNDEGARILAEQVLLGQSGARAGILPGDELLAVDGFRVTPADYVDRISHLEPGDTAELTLVRHGRLQTLTAEVQSDMPETFRITAKSHLRHSEKQRMQAWLGRDLQFND